MKKLPNISDAEWQIMEVVWRRHPVSVQEIMEELPAGTSWAPNTVRTLLSRLARKEALTVEEEGKRYLYRPALPRDKYVAKESDSFLDRIFGGAPSALLLHFARSGKISKRDLTELRRLLDQKRREP